MKHKWLRNYNSEGVWTKPERKINVDGVEHNLDEYAKKHGIDLPDAKKIKKQINKDIQEESYGDMGQAQQPESATEHGNGDSESTE